MRIYYVDTENRPTQSWASGLCRLKKTDEVILFVSKNSPKLSLDLIPQVHKCVCKLRIVEVHAGTPNAMDFIIVSTLSQRVLSARKSVHVIISADQGYDVVVDALSQKYNVSKSKAI